MSESGAAAAVYQAVWLPSGQHFAAPSDRTLLQAAAEAGLALANSCRNGTCRTCLTRLQGRVLYRIPWPGLLPEERQAGTWVLPCVAFPAGDVVLGDGAVP